MPSALAPVRFTSPVVDSPVMVSWVMDAPSAVDVPAIVMALYLLVARRLGAFEAL